MYRYKITEALSHLPFNPRSPFELDQVDSFLRSYALFSPAQKRIWSYLLSVHHYGIGVFPSMSMIALNSGCSRNTVQRAVNFFISQCYLMKKRRAYTSNIYFIPECLAVLDLDDIQTFTKNHVQAPK